MKKPLKKVLKYVGFAVLAILALGVLAVLTLPLWLGPVARPIANTAVSDITGAKFNLGALSLNPYVGTLHVGDVQLSNPTNGGFKVEENCVELGNLDVDVDMATVLSKKIVISSIVLDGLTIRTTVTGGNFMQIAENASGDAPAPAEEKASEPEPAKSSDAPKVQIDKLVLKNVTIKYGIAPLPVPTLTIEGIGADKEEGASLADALAAVKDKVLAAAGVVGGKLGELGADAAQAIGEQAGKAVGVVGEQAGKAVGVVGEQAGKAVEAVGEHAGKAVEAVGEHAGKALNAMKGLLGK